MDSRRDPTLTSTKLMYFLLRLYQQLHSHEKNLQSVRSVIDNNPNYDYSAITSGPTSKKNQIRRERESEIETQNMNLLEKLYNILSVDARPSKSLRKRSLNYPKRKKEIGRINVENRAIFKNLIDAKPSVNLKKINKWNEDMEKYKKNISASSRRANPHRPILTQGVVSAYPDIRAKTCVARGARKFSMSIPSIEHFTNLLNAEIF